LSQKQKEVQFEDAETAWARQLEELEARENSFKAARTDADTMVRNDNTVEAETSQPTAQVRPQDYQLIPYQDNNTRLTKKRVTKPNPAMEQLGTEDRQGERKKPTPNAFAEVVRSWPEPRAKGERRMTAANYAAVEIHGFFGLIDDGSDGAGRMLIVHVPRWVKGFFMDIKQGDTIHVYHAKGLKIGGVLTVLSTGRHDYYRPGRRVTTCTICVPEEQWAPFASLK
jgi:hypothetical protein